ncbi:DUF262 domain-containing protein [Nocardioides marmoraquaticus]
MRLQRVEMDLETIVRRINLGELDLQPEFQRGEVWDQKRQQRLVDTILRGWYVPAVHIVQEADRELVLDGQQRLATMRDFLRDEFKIDGTIEPYSQYIGDLHGRRFSQLPDNVRRSVNRFAVPVVYLSDHQPGEPNELFFRLNQSYNLTPPEKRNALHGAARNQVKDLVREMESWGLLERTVVGFSNARLAYDDIVARTCVAIEQNTLRRHINNTVVEQYYREGEFSARTIDAVRRAGHELHHQLQTAGRVKFNKGSLQTWLVYCVWAPIAVGPLPSQLLLKFERDRRRAKQAAREGLTWQDQQILGVLSVYDDRASYRVTDVASVVARDLTVHLYHLALFGGSGLRRSNEIVQHLLSDSKANPSTLVFQFADIANWGEPLLMDWRA